MFLEGRLERQLISRIFSTSQEEGSVEEECIQAAGEVLPEGINE